MVAQEVEVIFLGYLILVIQLSKDVIMFNETVSILHTLPCPAPYLDWNGFIEFSCKHDDDTKLMIKTGNDFLFE